ncbi:thiamine pyrophosphate-binding protein [Corynebacterium ciconiae]|uniref:thiamine pyrophosphate-binding protein n=1 Tax=Corynebacterium ciconiae TaxID=227319 RepID=UPI00035D782C|nr:thiamine pyrophosphate-binding protein [Corynebacterium ciconiae]
MTKRTGGDVVIECLTALGITHAFGIPGQHALGLFDALARGPMIFHSSRVENSAAFAADGYARSTDRPAALFLSTGPGALTALAGLQEANATGVPMLVICSQIPRDGLGARRKGMLHELDNQLESVRNVSCYQRTVRHTAAIPAVLVDAYTAALTAPQGPAWVEIPQDVLLEELDYACALPPVTDLAVSIDPRRPFPGLVERAAELMSETSTVILAGGGVCRSGASSLLRTLAERLDAPVVCTAGGVSALPAAHPLRVGFIEDRHVSTLLAEAETLLVLGSSLGEVSSNYYSLHPQGELIHVDADPLVLGSNHSCLGICADISEFPLALLPLVPAASHNAAATVAALSRRVSARLDTQDLAHERAIMAAIRQAIPDTAETFWDMTIAAYWAWNIWDVRAGAMHSAQGAGGLGFAFPAACGAAIGSGRRVLAVTGDGSAMYSIAELATAVQHDLAVTWLIIDDGGYGILREYMEGRFGRSTATELTGPDFLALARSFGVPATEATPESLAEVLTAAFAAPSGPQVVLLRTRLRMWEAS